MKDIIIQDQHLIKQLEDLDWKQHLQILRKENDFLGMIKIIMFHSTFNNTLIIL